MKQLFNYCSVPGCEAELKMEEPLPEYLRKLGLDGIELLVYRSEPYMRSYEKETIGVHLRNWNTWYDFWTNKRENIAEFFPTDEDIKAYYGGPKKRNWLLEMRRNIQAALMEKPEYLVFHIGEATPREQYSWNFAHSDMEVAKIAARIFNRLTKDIPENVLVLFENTCWPGLRLTDPHVLDSFLFNVHRDNIGIALDTGHLMSTNPDIRTEVEGIDYVCNTLKNMGSLTNYIKCVHLNCALAGEYILKSRNNVPKTFTEREQLAHLCNIDVHRPFTDPSVSRILEMLATQYLVHELFYEDFEKLAADITKQKQLLGL